MDLLFCGIVDIVLVIVLIISLIIGYKKGFLHKAISLIGVLVGLIVAFVFCQQLAGWLENQGVIYDAVRDNIYNTITQSDAYLESNGDMKLLLENCLGVPSLFSGWFAQLISSGDSLEAMSLNVAMFFAHIVTVVASFFILFVGVFILAIVLKVISAILRGNAIIKFIDGVLGIVLYGCLMLIFIYFVFAIIRILSNYEFFAPVMDFLNVDMMLDQEDKFRLSKYFYEHNIIYELIHLITAGAL